jgi:hypothetical protein
MTMLIPVLRLSKQHQSQLIQIFNELSIEYQRVQLFAPRSNQVQQAIQTKMPISKKIRKRGMAVETNVINGGCYEFKFER